MILNIKIENFRSIKDQVCVSFEATRQRELQDNYINIRNIGSILKSSVIYGANASGKSNILIAFEAIEYLVLNSQNFKPNKSIGPYEPFKLDVNSKKEPVNLELDFIANDNIRYIFSLSFTEYQIVKEKLDFFPKRQISNLYIRTGKKVKYGDYYKGERKSIEKKLLPNQLFLSKAIIDNVEILKPVYSFFDEQIMVFPFFRDYHESKYYKLYAERLADSKDRDFSTKFNKLICALDTGISKVESKEIDWTQNKLPDSVPEKIQEKIRQEYKYKIRTQHKLFENSNAVGVEYFDKEEESRGTQNLFVLAGIIIDVLEDGSVLIVDKFEKNLHPHITRYLIQLFYNPIINKHNAQLIFATHDITQLDNEIFRRDQIWFTEKDEFGKTFIYSLSDIKGIRSTIPYDKWYNSGQLGATPIINELEMLFDNE